MTGYTLGPTIFVLLLNVFFSREWLADAEARGLTDQQAQHALDVVTQVAAGSNPTVPYDPYLVQQGVELARADYSAAVMITMLIITVIPLVVAALAYFLIPPRRRQTIQATTSRGQETESPSTAP
jgi:MFS transporter, DHA2 family, multidrug resistance protein